MNMWSRGRAERCEIERVTRIFDENDLETSECFISCVNKYLSVFHSVSHSFARLLPAKFLFSVYDACCALFWEALSFVAGTIERDQGKRVRRNVSWEGQREEEEVLVVGTGQGGRTEGPEGRKGNRTAGRDGGEK